MGFSGFLRHRPRIAALFSAALFIALLPTPSSADDAAALLAKHKAFVGWQFGDGTVNSLLLERQVTSPDGKVKEKATEYRIGLGYRRDYTLTSAQGGGASGFTGKIFWRTNNNGFTVPIVGDEAKYLLIVDALFMEGTPQLTSTLGEPATVDGKTVQVVHLKMGGALPLDVYVDPETGAYRQATIDPGGANEETIHILSYKNIDANHKVIGSWTYGSNKNVYSYAKATLNASIPLDNLHPPAASATWTFANANPFPIKVTQDRIYVDAVVNGVPGRFILDTGASSIALTDSFADRAHLKTVGKGVAYGIGGEAKELRRQADTISFAGNTLSNVLVTTVNEKFDDKQYGEQLDGLIGFDLFGGAVVSVTLSNHTMTIKDPSTEIDPKIGFRVVPDLSTLTPTIPVRIADKIEANALLDSGGYDLILVSSQIEHHGIMLVTDREHQFLNGNARIAGVGGTEMVQCGQLSGIVIGPIHYTGLTVCESGNYDLHDALIGFDFIKKFDFVFDYPHGQMFMTPIKE